MRQSYQHSRFVTARVMNRPVHVQQGCSAFRLEADVARRKRDSSFGPIVLQKSAGGNFRGVEGRFLFSRMV
jgi:hypothetical protein